jgi:Tol biopolymer transport system component
LAHQDISELLKAGIQAAKERKKAEARRLLEQVLEIDDSSEPAWMWLASVVDTPREKRICLENVLEINPNNTRAREALAALGPAPVASTEKPRASTQSGPASQPRMPAGTTAPGDRRRRGLNPIIFLGGGALAIILIAIGLLMATNQIVISPPTPTVSGQIAPVVVQNGTAAPTLPPLGTVVTSEPKVIPSLTSTLTNTPNPSATPTPELPQLTKYRIVYTDKSRATWAMLADGSQKGLFLGSNSPPAYDFSFSDSGKIAYVGMVENNPQIFVADKDGKNAAAITKFTGEYVASPSITSAGTLIAFVLGAAGTSDNPTKHEIYTIKTDGSAMTQITENTGEDRDPAWSQDSEHLMFASDVSGKKSLQLVISDPDGKNPKQLTTSTGDNYGPSWSPDGKYVAFVSTRDRFQNIYVMEVANSLNTHLLTINNGEASNRTPDWSRDGSFIVFSSNRDGKVFNLYLITPDAKHILKIPGQDDKSDSSTPRFIPNS